MKTIHLLRVEAAPAAFADLFAAARRENLRIGWLDLEAAVELSPSLDAPGAAGAFRSVALTDRGTLVAKDVSGPVRLQDLLREHFLGCRLVLVSGEPKPVFAQESGDIGAALSAGGGGWTIRSRNAVLELSSRELVARLRRPAATFLEP